MSAEIQKKKDPDSHEKTAEFVKKNWPIALIVTGTLVGAAVWITARYLRNKKQREIELDKNLEQVEREAGTSQDPTVTILENGSYLGRIAGEEVKQATDEIGKHLVNDKEKEVIETLGNVASMESKSKNRRSGK